MAKILLIFLLYIAAKNQLVDFLKLASKQEG